MKQTQKGRITRIDQAWGPAHFEYAHRAALHEYALRETGWHPDAPLPAASAVAIREASKASTGAEVIPATQSLTMPIKLLSAALLASGRGDVRYYLNGVYLHAVDNELRVVATDGHRLLVSRCKVEEKLPEWTKAGVIIPRDDLLEVLPILAKHSVPSKYDHSEPTLVIDHKPGAANVILRSAVPFAAFTSTPIDGKFPDYARVLSSKAITQGQDAPLAATAINREYFKGAADMAAKLGATSIHAFMGDGECPAFFTFAGAPDSMLIIMPMRAAEPAISDGVVKILGPTMIAASVSALKAHVTRTDKALTATKNPEERKQLEARKTGFETRIAHLLASAGDSGAPKLEHRAAA